jgi:hypothetical protein
MAAAAAALLVLTTMEGDQPGWGRSEVMSMMSGEE